MKITTTYAFDEDDSYREGLKIYIDKEVKLSFTDWESEDNSLWRNFNDCYNVDKLLKEVYELWLKGEKIEFIKEEISREKFRE